MKRSWDQRGATLPLSVSKSPKTENTKIESSTPKSQISSHRKSRSPTRKSSSSPPPKKATVTLGKRHASRSGRTESVRPKRSRASARSRTPSRHVSKDKVSYAYTKESTSERASSRSRAREERYRSRDRLVVDRPSFRGPEQKISLDRDKLKKIVVNMRDSPTADDNIQREIVNPEDITVVRRAVTGGRRGRYHEDTGHRTKCRIEYEMEDRYCDYREARRQNTSEGSRPIFDRDEIKNSTRKFEEDEPGMRRIFSDSPPHSARKPSSSDHFRSRNLYYDDDRHGRHFPGSRHPKDYDPQHYGRHREERSRYARSRSHERGREFGHERRDKYDDRDYRIDSRSRIRGRPPMRPFRRHPSPIELRSPERDIESRRRDKELRPESDYPASDYPMEPHGYYQAEAVESQMPPSSRGGGHSIPFRGRGSSGVPLVIRGGPPVRPVRAVLIPRLPGMARRFPFPPRLIRPIVRPVIRVIAPVIPVRSPSVIPVRHPAIPLPFQCEAFR